MCFELKHNMHACALVDAPRPTVFHAGHMFLFALLPFWPPALFFPVGQAPQSEMFSP